MSESENLKPPVTILEQKHNWLKKNSVVVLQESPQTINESFLSQIGFTSPKQTVKKIEVITSQLFPNKKDWGNQWLRLGSESLNQIWSVDIKGSAGKEQCKHLALKAIIEFGSNLEIKAVDEAIRLTLLYQVDRAPRVYALSPGTIYRDFLLEDSDTLTEEDLRKESEKMFQEMAQVGIKPARRDGPEWLLKSQTILHNKRLRLIDGSSGDLDGPSFNSLIANN